MSMYIILTWGELGLAFLSIFVSLLIFVPVYMIYFRVVVERKILENLSEGVGSLEQFLLADVWVSWVLPAGMFYSVSSVISNF